MGVAPTGVGSGLASEGFEHFDGQLPEPSTADLLVLASFNEKQYAVAKRLEGSVFAAGQLQYGDAGSELELEAGIVGLSLVIARSPTDVADAGSFPEDFDG